MVDGNFEQDCYSGLKELFWVVSRAKGEATVQACLRHLIDLPDVSVGGTKFTKMDFYLLPYCLHNPTNLSAYIKYLEGRDAYHVPHIIMMLKLYGYVQCIEVKYIYKVVGNLLGEIGGGPTSGDLYDNVLSARKCFDDVRERHECIKSSSGQTFAIVDLWSCFLDFDLRNAIGHSDFIINNESRTILIPSYVLKEPLDTKQSLAEKSKKSVYSFSEIDNLYSKANAFNEVFKRAIQEYGFGLGPRY